MHSTTHSHHQVDEYKEQEEEEKTFNAKTNPIDNATVIMEMEPLHHSNQRETIIHPRKSSEKAMSLSWSHEEEKLEPNVQSIGLSCEDDIINCKAIKRVINLLEFYKLHQHALLNNEESVIPLFEHISQKDYGIPMFMEDWYQCKRNHFKTPNDIHHFQSIEAINCDDESCVYVRRYQRDRSRGPHHDPHKEIDYKNIILMDELNSIHTFIFHWMPSRFKSIETSSLNRALKRIPLNAEQEDDSNQRIDNDEEEED
eukprot:362933_1